MKILVIADYPRPGHEVSGVLNERCVKVLREFCDRVDVMAHRPYLPQFLSSVCLVPRWKSWAAATYEIRDGISIHRPPYLQVPRVGSAYWVDRGAFFWCRRTARELHRRFDFDAILSFDLFGAGALAWRIGGDLEIPASGWAIGSDVRKPAGSRLEKVVTRAIKRLDLVFYQSQELFKIAARLSGVSPQMMPKDKHVVLPRGIPEPPSMCRTETRTRIRTSLGIKEDTILVLSVVRIDREKGVFELLEAVSLAVARDPRISCVLLGSAPAFDETIRVQKVLNEIPILKERVKLLPVCSPDKVWEYLCAADIFAFPSHHEGMPNSLLEAMAMGLPSIAFAIPPVLEIEAKTGALVLVPPLDSALFAQALLRLASSSVDRVRIGETGKIQVMERFMVRNSMAEACRRIAQVVNRRNSVEWCEPSLSEMSSGEFPRITAFKDSGRTKGESPL